MTVSGSIGAMRVAVTVALVLLLGCASEPARQRPAPANEPSKAELERVRGLAEVVLVGEVDRAEEGPEGRFYVVRVTEVLKATPSAQAAATTHPHAVDTTLQVGDYLFRGQGAQGGTIGRLEELTRYIFFLSPAEPANRWLNLHDAAALPLPEAQKTLDALRAKRDQGRPAGAPPPASEAAPSAEAPPGR